MGWGGLGCAVARVDSRLVTLPAPPSATGGEIDRRGLAAGFGGYLWWGMLPLYFPLLAPAGPWEITAHRVLWSLLLCLLVLAMLGQLGRFWRLLRTTRVSARLGLAAVLLSANWVTFVLAVLTGHVVEASLGYYINPLVTAGMAVTILGERLRTAQWVAAGLGATGVVVIAVGNGTFPWISLVLAGTFGGYGLVKKQVGEKVPALPGLGVETLTLAPAALVLLVVLAVRGEGSFGGPGELFSSTGLALLLVGSGVLTTVPLVLFAAAARRLPLAMLGLLQYVTPTMQYLTGVFLYHEQMSATRWAGFAVVWVALVVLSTDGYRATRTATPRPRRET